MTKQDVLKKMYTEHIDIFIDGKLFPVRRARTCRNCYFYTGCDYPQKKNPKYNPISWKNNRDRYELIPDGYCIPVRVWHADEDYNGDLIKLELDKLFKVYCNRPVEACEEGE